MRPLWGRVRGGWWTKYRFGFLCCFFCLGGLGVGFGLVLLLESVVVMIGLIFFVVIDCMVLKIFA